MIEILLLSLIIYSLYLNVIFLEHQVIGSTHPTLNTIFFRFHCLCLACLTNILPLDNERKAKQLVRGVCCGGWDAMESVSQVPIPKTENHKARNTQQKLIIIKSESAGEMALVVVLVFAFCFSAAAHSQPCLWFRLCFLSRRWGFHNICIGVGLFAAQVFV